MWTFAVDSIPAVFGVTHDPFIVYTSNVFAILGLRAMYFLLAGVLDRLRYLDQGLAFVLMFIGAKMIGERWGSHSGRRFAWSRGRRAGDRAAGVGSDAPEEKTLSLILLQTSARRRSTTSSFRPALASGTIGCLVEWKCFVACLFFEESQQPTWPQLKHSGDAPNCRPS